MDEELERVLNYAMKEMDYLRTILENATEQEDVRRISTLARHIRGVGDDITKAIAQHEDRRRGFPL